MSRSLIAALLCCTLAASASDLKYVRTTTDSSGLHAPEIFYFQGDRVRIDHRTEFGYEWKAGHPSSIAYGPRMSTIYQCDMHRVLNLDFDHHQYTVTDLDRGGKPIHATAPETAPPRSTGVKVKVVVETRDTGETREMFGHTAHHFITTRKQIPSAGACSTAQKTTEDGWYIDMPPRPMTCRQMSQSGPPKGIEATLVSGNCRDDYQVERSGPTPPPFAVELTITTDDDSGDSKTSTESITELSSLPLDPQMFDLPTGFKRVRKLDDSPNLPWLLRGRLLWQNVKSTVWGWTPWGR